MNRTWNHQIARLDHGSTFLLIVKQKSQLQGRRPLLADPEAGVGIRTCSLQVMGHTG
nr:hypothetical protein Q903MT_gene509 [Picea sitchensis]